MRFGLKGIWFSFKKPAFFHGCAVDRFISLPYNRNVRE